MYKIFCACLVLALSGITSLFYGNPDIPFFTFLSEIFGPSNEDRTTILTIFYELRLPRTAVCLLCGSALGVAGGLSQNLFRNPLASPNILGITSAGAAAATATIFFASSGTGLNLGVPIAAFCGCLAALILLFVLYSCQGNTDAQLTSIFVCGVAIGSMCAAATSLIIAYNMQEQSRLSLAMFWLMGSIDARAWSEIIPVSIVILVAFLAAAWIIKKLELLWLGADTAESLGVAPRQLFFVSVILIAVFESMSIVLAGAIGFLGLMVPHITRQLNFRFGREFVIGCALNGATMLILADIAARTSFYPIEIPTGIFTALIGSIFFLYLAIGKRGKNFI